jgi:hypothetical protein
VLRPRPRGGCLTPLKKHASPERKAHAYLLLSAYTRDEMSYEEVARITGPQGDYPFTDGEMSRSTLDRIVERAARTGDPAFRKLRATTGTLTVPEHRLLVRELKACSVTPDRSMSAYHLASRPSGDPCPYRSSFPLHPCSFFSPPCGRRRQTHMRSSSVSVRSLFGHVSIVIPPLIF